MKLRISTPATSANLGAGFDCLGLALNLRNEFIVQSSKLNRLHISGYSANASAIKQNNAFVGIFKSTLKSLGHSSDNISFSLHNAIPLSRGLGSSSSVIIAAIAAAFAFAKRSLEFEELLELSLAYEPHTDNTAPCALGGFVISLADEQPVRFDVSPKLKAVVAVPLARISTKASRQALAQSINLKDACYNISKASLISAAFASGDFSLLKGAWGDRLHQRARMNALSGVYKNILQALAKAGAFSKEDCFKYFSSVIDKDQLPTEANKALFCALSGSGSSFISLCYQEHAQSLCDALSSLDELEAVYNLELSNTGLIIEEID